MRPRELGFLKFFKGLTFLGLAFAFCLNNYCNLLDFASERETRSTRLVYVEKGLELPAITICNMTAYKNIERNLKLKDYLKNTIELNDFFAAIYYTDVAKHEDQVAEDFVEVRGQVKTRFFPFYPIFSGEHFLGNFFNAFI